MDRGLPAGRPPEWFALERPAVLEEIARLYLEAKADLITTDTFGGSRMRLALDGLGDRVGEVNRAAVEAIRRAVDGRAYVSASVGPTGRLLRPHGDTDPRQVRESFAEQIGHLAAAGADLICIETMSDLAEAVEAVRAARDAAPGLPVMATMTFEPTRRGYFTVMGTGVEAAVAGLESAGAEIVGSNCGTGIDAMVEIARVMARATRLPIAIQPNAGMPETVRGQTIYRETPELMSGRAGELLDLGVRIVGGCCGTTPAHVQALRRAVDGWVAAKGGAGS
jgi:5-methyltetrahydrofolate--homocysteine methyltransferase